MLILISNDDGIQAAGLRALAAEMAHLARVVVVAPDREQSASSHSLTLHRPLRVNRVQKDWYAVDGTPTDCVTLAIDRLLTRKPDLVISGINHGPNLGDDVMYSGTVAAAFEGFVQGVTSLAVSQMGWRQVDLAKSARFVRRFVQGVPTLFDGQCRLLNINLPPPGRHGLRSFRVTRLAHRTYSDVIQEKLDPRGRAYYWIAGSPSWKSGAGTDVSAVRSGAVSVTPLSMDYTDYAQLDVMKDWSLARPRRSGSAARRPAPSRQRSRAN
jgi:5'-nucleotidase